MREDFLPVYMASTVAVAQRLADRLTRAGIETFVDDTESPLYGMSLGPQSKVVHVRAPTEGLAREIIRDFQEEYDPPQRPEDWEGEATGLELPKPQRPSDDSPNEPYSPGTERMAAASDPDNPEISEMVDDSGQTRPVRREDVSSVDADRPVAETPDVETPEVQEQSVEDMDVGDHLDVDELKHPAAEPPQKKKGRGKKQ